MDLLSRPQCTCMRTLTADSRRHENDAPVHCQAVPSFTVRFPQKSQCCLPWCRHPCIMVLIMPLPRTSCIWEPVSSFHLTRASLGPQPHFMWAFHEYIVSNKFVLSRFTSLSPVPFFGSLALRPFPFTSAPLLSMLPFPHFGSHFRGSI